MPSRFRIESGAPYSGRGALCSDSKGARTELELGPFIAQGEKLPPYSLLSNIINNALKASPAGGTVKIGLHEEERKCRILVRNDGAILQTIRDRFF